MGGPILWFVAASKPSRSWRSFSVGYALLGGFFALEVATRSRGTAASLDASADDRGTTEGIQRAYAVAGVAAPMLLLVPAPRLPRGVVAFGPVLEVSGIALRAWSMRTLGRAYTRTLRIEGGQQVVDDGPYGFVRHPGYLGSLLIWTGFGLSSGSVPAAGVVAAVVGDAYRRRISAEETLLGRALPGYSDYVARTKRLVPFIW